jgi:hypothetical protein
VLLAALEFKVEAMGKAFDSIKQGLNEATGHAKGKRAGVKVGSPPAPASTTPADEPPTQVTPAPEKIGEGPGNLKARERAFKRRTGVR